MIVIMICWGLAQMCLTDTGVTNRLDSKTTCTTMLTANGARIIMILVAPVLLVVGLKFMKAE